MKFPKKTNYMLLLFLIALSFILRFPSTPHSVGIDAFVMQGLANCIVADGYAAWIIHPLSYLGLFPLSYPSGGIFLPATLVTLSGSSSEMSILSLSYLMGIIGVLGAYLLAREFKDDDMFAFLVAFVFCLAPKFILNTTWETPTRGGFMALTPMFLWALLRAHKNPTRTNVAMTILMLFILSAFHRLAILMLVVILAYIFAYLFFVVVKIAKLVIPNILLRPKVRHRLRLAGVIGLFAAGSLLIVGSGVLDVYKYGRLISPDVVPNQLILPLEFLNLGISITRGAGVLTPLLIVGAIVWSYQRNKTLKDSFLLFAVLAVTPTLYLRRYTGFYLPIFIALLVGLGVAGVLYVVRKRKKMSVAIFIVIVLTSVGLTGVLLDYESENSEYMGMEEYNIGLYTRSRVEGTLLSNYGVSASRISAVSGLAYLPIGGATVARNGPEQLAFGFISGDEVEVSQIAIAELTLNDDSPFKAQNVPVAQDDFWNLHLGVLDDDDDSFETFRTLINQYNIQYVLEDKRLIGEDGKTYFTAYAKEYLSKLTTNLHWQRFRIYESDDNTVWAIGVKEN